MSLPPPIPKPKRPSVAPRPATPQPHPVKKSGSSKVPIIIGACTIGTGLIIALILWLLSSSLSRDADSYSSGDNDAAKDWLHSEQTETPVEEEAVADVAVSRRSLSGFGVNSKSPFYIHMNFHGDNVSGHYYNLLYGLELPLSGTVDGSSYSLTLGRGNEESHLSLYEQSPGEFTGSWGKNHKPVTAHLYPDANLPSVSTSGMVHRYEGKFKGGGVSQDIVFMFTSDFNKALMYYKNLGINYALNLSIVDPNEGDYIVYCNGRKVATAYLYIYDDYMDGTFTNLDGAEFSLDLSAR